MLAIDRAAPKPSTLTPRVEVAVEKPVQKPAAQTTTTQAPRSKDEFVKGTAAPSGSTPTTPPELQRAIDALPRDTIPAADIVRMNQRLAKMDPATRGSQVKFLQTVLASKNPDRALSTYLDLKTLQDTRPDRISDNIVRTLTMGVGRERTNNRAGAEGVLGKQQALDAARTLVNMSATDYQALTQRLDYGGARDKGPEAKGADVETERALVLKAVAARDDSLINPGFFDRARNMVGQPSSTMQEVLTYADKIKQMPREELLRKSTFIDLQGGANALQQRFTMSCGPTSMQIARADADPIYALAGHEAPIHSVSSRGRLADEQRAILDGNGGAARSRDPEQAGGIGMWPETGNTLNQMVGTYANKTYNRNTLANTPQARGAALERADKLLRNGQDVPIVVAWNGGGSHVQMLTDVRGTGNNREYLMTDPWHGSTQWVRHSDIVAGNTNFTAGTGRLWVTYE
jgi:hypothetical protein